MCHKEVVKNQPQNDEVNLDEQDETPFVSIANSTDDVPHGLLTKVSSKSKTTKSNSLDNVFISGTLHGIFFDIKSIQ